MSKKRTDWRSPLRIPPGKRGEYEIVQEVIPPGEGVLLNTSRNQLLGGQRGANYVTFNEPTTWHRLTYGGGTWMTDYPVEQRQHDGLLKGFKGRVLVGGLGLGYAVAALARKKAVKHIDVVEISPEVIDLVWPHARHAGKANVINADLLEFLNGGLSQWDYAFYDIWQRDSEQTFFDIVVPLHQRSAGKVRRPPVCWQEGVMRGQLAWSLQSRLINFSHPLMAPDLEKLAAPYWEPWPQDEFYKKFHDWSVPFFRWWREVKDDEGMSQEKVQRAIQFYAGLYGLAGWERRWECAKFALS